MKNLIKKGGLSLMKGHNALLSDIETSKKEKREALLFFMVLLFALPAITALLLVFFELK